MAKKVNKVAAEDKSDLFKDLISKIKVDSIQESKIPSILEFVESKEYLGLPHGNPSINLFDLQKLVLKCFYRGSDGNKDSKLNPEDLALIEKHNLNSPENGAMLDKWNSNNDFRELVLVWGRRCLSENTEIIDPKTGRIWQMGEMWNYGLQNIDSWTYDLKSNKMRLMDNCNFVYQGKKEVYKIQTNTGHEIESTIDHKFLTEDGWKQLKDLKIKDKIAVAAHQPFFGDKKEINAEEASILGYLTSDMCDSVGSFIATKFKDDLVLNDFNKKIGQIDVESNQQKIESFNIKTFSDRKYTYVYSKSSQLEDFHIVNFLERNGLKNKTNLQKFVPARIFTSPKEVVSSYLKSLFSCDAKVIAKENKKITYDIDITFESIILVKQIQHLLSRFCIFSSFDSRIVNNKTEYTLTINKNDNVRNFVDEIGFLDSSISENIIKNTKKNTKIDHITYSKITSIKKIGEKRTFDIQVSQDESLQNFTANGFICHNCVSEDSVLVDARTGEKFTFKQAWINDKPISSWTYDEKQKKMVIIDDCNVIKQERRMVYRITDSFNNQIDVTENHPFLTQRGWIECKDLKDGDKLTVSISSPPIFGNSDAISENEAAILGYITGDGCCSQGSVFFTAKNEEIKEDFEKRLAEFSDNIELVQDTWTKADSKKYAYKIRSREFVSVGVYNEDNKKVGSARSKNDVVKLLIKHNLMGKTSHSKCVPDALFNCPKNVIAAYLKALFSCDGWIMIASGKRDIKTPNIGFSTANGQQIIAVAKLLSKFGIHANIRRKICNTKIITEGKLYEYKNVINFQINFTKQKDIIKYIEEIGFIGKNKETQKQAYSIAKNIKSRDFKNKETIMTSFLFREEVGERDTFDLQVSHEKHLQNFTCVNYLLKNSGKDFLCAIIALYEAMRLLEAPGGNPYKIYNLGSATPFTILTIANSSSQAQILFREIKDKVLRSDYFKDKILPEGLSSDSIHFLTPEDKRRNEELKKNGFAPTLGSIVVKSGHSNSDSLVGISCYVLLLDEIGLYKNTAGSSSGDAIYNSLGPAVKTYVREIPIVDKSGDPVIDTETGKQKTNKIYDGKIICLSTPRGKEGIFFNLYDNHLEAENRLVCRAATWQVNPMQTKEGLIAAFPEMPEEKFRMEFGAEFSGTAGENFFPEEALEKCFRDKNLRIKEYGVPGLYYFAHLDPATSSHNYALILAHRESYFDKETSKKDWVIIVDHIKYWSPTPGKPISVEEVDDYVSGLNMKFCLGLVTYDHFNSQTSITKLRKKGIPTKMTAFTKAYKNIIYDNLYQLVIQGKILIPNHLLLKNEMKNLQRKWTNSGYKVYAKKDGDVTTDDLVDALAGACYNCIEKDSTKLPQGRMVSFPVQGGNDIVWKSMSGQPYGVGSGQQVANNLEKRSSYPRRGV